MPKGETPKGGKPKGGKPKKGEPRAPDPRAPDEVGGPKGPEPTRYGDWERGGRAVDF
ncbi:MAG: DUF1674 domain-containing protein [Alphaproteobacteria bacterium]